ncbi:MAG: ATP-binding protein [Spirochaetes bacterium]|nr:ATP-binding protein [Spirochaetota bacterium]
MKIRILLASNAFVVSGIALATVAFLLFTSNAIVASNQKAELVNAAKEALFRRIVLRDEYLVHRGEYDRQRLLEALPVLASRLEGAKAAFTQGDDAGILKAMRGNESAVTSIYRKLFAIDARAATAGRARYLLDEYERRLLSQLLIRSYRLNDDATNLERNQISRSDLLRRRFEYILMAGSILTVVFVVVNGSMARGSISRGFERVLRGTREIGGGNLGYRLEADRVDEMGELAGEINSMASKLMLTVRNLEREAEQRKAAEEQVLGLIASLEERVKARTAELASANRELEAFAYSISHDLKAPLRSIEGFSRMVLEDYDERLDDEGKRLLGVILDSAARLDTLISDILSLSRIGRIEITLSRVDMRSMAEAAYGETALPGEKEKIIFTLADIPPAFCDPTLIRQVWMNLVSNAVKYTSRSERRVIRIDAEKTETETMYRVADSGAGFNMAYADKLFGIFQRLHAVEEFEGTGVGLAIVKRIMERHGGKVGAEGKVGEGASFWFSLPALHMAGEDSDGNG